MAWINLPQRTPNDPNSSADINALQGNILSLKGGTASQNPASTISDLSAKNVAQDNAISTAQTTANDAQTTANDAVSVNNTQNGRLDALEAATPPTPTSITTTSTTFPAGYNDNVCVIEYTGTAAVTWSLPTPSAARKLAQRRLTIINNSSDPQAQMTLSGSIDNVVNGEYPILPARGADATVDSFEIASTGVANAYDFIPSNESDEWTLINQAHNRTQIVCYRANTASWTLPMLYYIAGYTYGGSASTTWALPSALANGVHKTAKTLTISNISNYTLAVTGVVTANTITLFPGEIIIVQCMSMGPNAYGWRVISRYYTVNIQTSAYSALPANGFTTYTDGTIDIFIRVAIPPMTNGVVRWQANLPTLIQSGKAITQCSGECVNMDASSEVVIVNAEAPAGSVIDLRAQTLSGNNLPVNLYWASVYIKAMRP